MDRLTAAWFSSMYASRPLRHAEAATEEEGGGGGGCDEDREQGRRGPERETLKICVQDDQQTNGHINLPILKHPVSLTANTKSLSGISCVSAHRSPHPRKVSLSRVQAICS